MANMRGMQKVSGKALRWMRSEPIQGLCKNESNELMKYSSERLIPSALRTIDSVGSLGDSAALCQVRRQLSNTVLALTESMVDQQDNKTNERLDRKRTGAVQPERGRLSGQKSLRGSTAKKAQKSLTTESSSHDENWQNE